MSLHISGAAWNLTGVGLAAVLGLANAAMAQSIEGTATFREPMALPPGAVFEATLEDASRADAPATKVASTRVTSPGNPPIEFTINYDVAAINPANRYVVRARVLLDGSLLFISDSAAPVITQRSPKNVSLMLRRVSTERTMPEGAGSATPPAGSSVSLQQTYWRAIELAGQSIPAQGTSREAHLQFQADGRVFGSDGCNRVMGMYDLQGTDEVTFGRMAGTQMACADTAAIEQAFREALAGTGRWAINDNRLELFSSTGSRLAVFEARAQAPSELPPD